MLYPILIEHQNGHYRASVLVMPELTEVAATRDEVLSSIQRAIRERLHAAELVYVDMPLPTDAPETEHHWLATAGIFADDPTLQPMLKEIYAAREAEQPN
ncbi:MAG: hypothetical protein U0350_20580 [Caldilineaceae bacterium]